MIKGGTKNDFCQFFWYKMQSLTDKCSNEISINRHEN
jgi:hypothetical protein